MMDGLMDGSFGFGSNDSGSGGGGGGVNVTNGFATLPMDEPAADAYVSVQERLRSKQKTMLSSYARERTQDHNSDDHREESAAAMSSVGDMTFESIATICRLREDLYTTPELNHRLFLNYQGYKTIANLERFTDLRTLFIDHNRFDDVPATPLPLPLLSALYLNANSLTSMDRFATFLFHCTNLRVLNLSDNRIESVTGLHHLTALRSLDLSNNALSDVRGIAECPSLQELNLSGNNLTSLEPVLDTLRALMRLRVLYLKGNPFVAKAASYRRTILSSILRARFDAPHAATAAVATATASDSTLLEPPLTLPTRALPTSPSNLSATELDDYSLTFLDDRPVTEDESRAVWAWHTGGTEKERVQREHSLSEKREREERSMELWRQQRAERRASQSFALGNSIQYRSLTVAEEAAMRQQQREEEAREAAAQKDAEERKRKEEARAAELKSRRTIAQFLNSAEDNNDDEREDSDDDEDDASVRDARATRYNVLTVESIESMLDSLTKSLPSVRRDENDDDDDDDDDEEEEIEVIGSDANDACSDDELDPINGFAVARTTSSLSSPSLIKEEEEMKESDADTETEVEVAVEVDADTNGAPALSRGGGHAGGSSIVSKRASRGPRAARMPYIFGFSEDAHAHHLARPWLFKAGDGGGGATAATSSVLTIVPQSSVVLASSSSTRIESSVDAVPSRSRDEVHSGWGDSDAEVVSICRNEEHAHVPDERSSVVAAVAAPFIRHASQMTSALPDRANSHRHTGVPQRDHENDANNEDEDACAMPMLGLAGLSGAFGGARAWSENSGL